MKIPLSGSSDKWIPPAHRFLPQSQHDRVGPRGGGRCAGRRLWKDHAVRRRPDRGRRDAAEPLRRLGWPGPGHVRQPVTGPARHRYARYVRIAASAYTAQMLASEWRETPAATLRAALACPYEALATQGHILPAADFTATLAVEAAIHYLDMTVALPAAPRPDPASLALARRVLDQLAGSPLPEQAGMMSPAYSRGPAASPSPGQTSRRSDRPQAGFPSSAERTRPGRLEAGMAGYTARPGWRARCAVGLAERGQRRNGAGQRRNGAGQRRNGAGQRRIRGLRCSRSRTGVNRDQRTRAMPAPTSTPSNVSDSQWARR